MKRDWSDIEEHRVSPKGYESKPGDHFGWFLWEKGGTMIRAMSTDGEGTNWEHVSISVAYRSGKKMVERCPKWEEMCFVKSQFWGSEECVVQFHPPDKNYVNTHNHCLHLWKSIRDQFPLPPEILV